MLQEIEAAFDPADEGLVGRIIPSPPTQPFVGAVQHVIGGKLREDRHTKQLMPAIGDDKKAAATSSRLLCGAWVWSWPIAIVRCSAAIRLESGGKADMP
jgi:hypothetical protein